jgi:ribonucleoside-diphosphate reductase alpha chain
MKGYDAIAGAIKSGGATRRAAKMVILNADHPDIADFINCKVDEERKAHALIAAGYDPALDGPAYSSIFYQNANHSVRVTDEFMRAFESDGEWQTHYITSGKVADTYRARDLMRQISEAAWHCGDPGMQFDTTINEWHTSPASGRINASNPCFTGDTRLLTDRGWLKIAAIVQRAARGELVRVATQGADGQEMTVSLPERYMVTGHNPIVRLTFADGREVRCTPNHRFLTANRGMVEASALTETDDVLTATGPVIEFERAQSQLPLPAALRERARESYTALPLEWTAGLAEMLGHVAAAGTVAEGTVSWTYGEEARSDVLPAHRTLLQGGPGTSAQVTVTEGGTVSVRLDEGPLGEVFEALGLHRAGASGAGVPEVLFEAPAAAMSGFLRGMFDAAATVNPSGAPAARFISLPLRSRALAGDVQLLLQGLGISSVVRQDFVTGESGATAAVHEVRVSGSALDAFRGTVGFEIRSKREALDRCASTRPQPARRRTQLVQRQDDGVELTYNLTEPVNHSYIAQGLVAANCSEYMYLDDTACNLASLNLMRFVDERGDLKVDDFRHAVQLTISAQEMIVSSASYPTAAIEKNSHRYRTLGLGYANLGALLMSRGLAYDSEDGRAYAAAITSLMCGEAYAQSARIARAVGPCEGWKPNARPMQHVIDKHRKAARAIERTLVPSPLWQASSEVWDDAYQLGAEHGFRNMQVTVLAPTGTISFMMDCDTTGVEPDIALVKYKRLVGGGMLKIVNTTVPAALRKLGYKPTQVAEIVDFVDVHDTIEGAPQLKAEHLAVFDCAFKPARGQRSIHYMGHVRMMAATQPFISGAISKTVNLPNEATVEDIEEAYVQAWKMGLKAIAIYRDGCKVSQPMSTSKEQAESKTQPGTAGVAQGAAQAAAAPEPVAQRRRLPDERRSITHKFSIEGHEGYITVGMYDDGKPGEIFLVMAKEGSTISGLMDSFATAISLSLQYGVPLEALVQKFAHARFEPAGYTTNREIPIAKSIVDYIFRWLGTKFLSPEDQDMLGIVRRVAAAEPSPSAPVTPEAAETVAKAAEAPAPQPATQPVPVAQGAVEGVKIAFNNTTDAPSCPECGSIMVRNAACYKCLNCGATSGCS